uniref:ATP synthase complex subunit 8 n=1 Tax=Dorcus cervulus TaxID=3074309 RepID=A0AA51UN56_9SCAR|nr:ATP synthase F0 subunit 8 [Dorcus cervulus]WMW30237.1 ATP synthase F0 subunit 8 [Dorcus cervulus]
MPQMAPLNWLILMILFSMILIFISITNFSIFSQTPKNFFMKKSSLLKSWKW